MSDYIHRGTHSHVLANGREVGDGDIIKADELQAADHYLIEEGQILDIDELEAGAAQAQKQLEEQTAPSPSSQPPPPEETPHEGGE